MEKLSPKTMLLELLTATPHQQATVQQLLRGAETMGIDANRVRVSLNRLKSLDLVESPHRGLYRLGKRTLPLQREVSR